jgi:hypothetical protein
MALVGLAGAGCGQTDAAPPSFGASRLPEVVYLVHNEVQAIRLDGTGRRLLGAVGDDKHRTGWPRLMPDGRVAVLGDETGGIFPYVESPPPSSGRTLFRRLSAMNVTLNDALCGVTINGQSRLVFTATPFLPTRTTLERVDVDDPRPVAVHYESAGVLQHPAPYDDGHVLVVRVKDDGTSTVELLDVSVDVAQPGATRVLASVRAPYVATQPARLPDGRVVFIRVDPRDVSDTAIGEMYVIELDGQIHTTGLTGVLGLEVIGDQIVYESGGANEVSDLIVTDLAHPPVNLTNTPYTSEHITWSD